MTVDDSWTIERRREVVARAVELYRLRGTATGLQEQIEIHTGGTVEIIENGGTAWSIDPGGELPGSRKPLVAATAWQGLSTGQVDAILENWGHDQLKQQYIDNMGVAQSAGSTGNKGQIGWYVPPWMVQKYPDITDWHNLNKYAEVFRTSESGDKGQLRTWGAASTEGCIASSICTARGCRGILSEQAGHWYYKRNLGDGRFVCSRRCASCRRPPTSPAARSSSPTSTVRASSTW